MKERKRTEINNASKPNAISVELKDIKTRRMENPNIIPLRISSLDKGSNSTVPSVLLTQDARLNIDKSILQAFS